MSEEQARAQIEAAVQRVVAVAVMRKRFTAGDFSTVALIDRIVAGALS